MIDVLHNQRKISLPKRDSLDVVEYSQLFNIKQNSMQLCGIGLQYAPSMNWKTLPPVPLRKKERNRKLL